MALQPRKPDSSLIVCARVRAYICVPHLSLYDLKDMTICMLEFILHRLGDGAY